jgi:cellulose synthase/poly-beta-1,6-N-acetylglucosamine synthase-like glycosyltransferase
MLKTERDGRSAKQNESEAVALAEHDQPVQPELSILIPCLNEARTLAACIKKAQLFLKLQGVSAEIIVADNGITDGSVAIAQNGAHGLLAYAFAATARLSRRALQQRVENTCHG